MPPHGLHVMGGSFAVDGRRHRDHCGKRVFHHAAVSLSGHVPRLQCLRDPGNAGVVCSPIGKGVDLRWG